MLSSDLFSVEEYESFSSFSSSLLLLDVGVELKDLPTKLFGCEGLKLEMLHYLNLRESMEMPKPTFSSSPLIFSTMLSAQHSSRALSCLETGTLATGVSSIPFQDEMQNSKRPPHLRENRRKEVMHRPEFDEKKVQDLLSLAKDQANF